METLELYKKAGENTAMNNKRKAIMQEIKKLASVEEVYWIKMEADEIRWEVDYAYTGDSPRDIMVVEYKDEYQAHPSRVLYWEHMTPKELAKGVEI